MSGKPLFQLDVNIDKNFYKQVKNIADWPKRMKNVMPMISEMSARNMMENIQSKIPNSASYKGYSRGLEVVRVRGTKPGEYSYAIQLDKNNRFVKSIPVQSALLYIHPAKRMSAPDKGVEVLEKYNPWTAESLPYKPDSKIATIISRKARPKDVQKHTYLRNRQRSKWSKELTKLGIRENRKDVRLKLPKSLKNLPSAALDGLKLEFGMGGQKPKAIWRPAFSQARRTGFKMFAKDKRYIALPLAEPSYNRWRSWPPRTKHSISISQAKKYSGFQKKVAGR